ncbi:MAG: hypothetical protein HY791_05895 [Deltaproteobacteria bacterium]|nr:hypothetical protein [Deltaproteobacteria bacterium]
MLYAVLSSTFRSLRAAAPAVAVILACCSERIELSLPTDGWIVLAALTEAGDVTSTELIRGRGEALERELLEGELPVAFSLDAATELYAADGSTADLGLKLSHQPDAGCGRCLADSREPPFLIFQGSTCPLPSWVAAAYQEPLTPNAIELARRQIRLGSLGDCGCLPPLTRKAPIAEARLVDGEFPFVHAATSQKGTVALVGQDRATLIGLDGSRRDVPMTFSDPIRGVAALGESFAVLTGAARNSELIVFDPELSQVESMSLTVDPGSATLLTAADAVLVLGEESDVSIPVTKLCSGAPLKCAEISPGAARRRELAVDAVITASLKFVVLYSLFGAQIYDRAPSPEEVVGVEPDRVVVRSGNDIEHRKFAIEGFFGQKIGALGDRVFVCGAEDDLQSLYTFELGDPEGTLTRAAQSGGSCTGFRLSSSTTIDAAFGGLVIRLDAQGREVRRLTPDEALPGAGAFLRFPSHAKISDSRIAFGESGLVLRTSTTTAARRVWGLPSWQAAARLVAHRDDVWLIHPAHTRKLGGAEGPGLGFNPVDVISDGVRLVALDPGGQLVTFDPDSGQIESRIALPTPTGWPARVAAFGPSDYLVVSKAAPFDVWRVWQGETRTLELSWDIPSTLQVESPPPLVYGLQLDARAGSAFVGGSTTHEGFAFRILPIGDGGARIERVILPQSTDVDGLIARCPDEAFLWSVGDQATDVIEIHTPGGIPTATSFEQVHFRGSATGSSLPIWTDSHLFRLAPLRAGGLQLTGFPDGPELTLDGYLGSSARSGSHLEVLAHNGAVWRIDVRDQ